MFCDCVAFYTPYRDVLDSNHVNYVDFCSLGAFDVPCSGKGHEDILLDVQRVGDTVVVLCCLSNDDVDALYNDW